MNIANIWKRIWYPRPPATWKSPLAFRDDLDYFAEFDNSAAMTTLRNLTTLLPSKTCRNNVQMIRIASPCCPTSTTSSRIRISTRLQTHTGKHWHLVPAWSSILLKLLFYTGCVPKLNCWRRTTGIKSLLVVKIVACLLYSLCLLVIPTTLP